MPRRQRGCFHVLKRIQLVRVFSIRGHAYPQHPIQLQIITDTNLVNPHTKSHCRSSMEGQSGKVPIFQLLAHAKRKSLDTIPVMVYLHG
jgi:hypothetical protein